MHSSSDLIPEWHSIHQNNVTVCDCMIPLPIASPDLNNQHKNILSDVTLDSNALRADLVKFGRTLWPGIL